MKRYIFFICILCICVISSCSRKHILNDEKINSKNESQIVISKEIKKADDNVVEYSSVVKIKIVDENPYEYDSCLDITLDYDEVDKLLHLASKCNNNNNINMKKAWYSLKFLDDKDNVIDVWTVDIYRTITTLNNYKIKRIDEIDSILSDIEMKHGISKNLLKRKPGKNYFCKVNKIDNGVFQKRVETNFDDNYELFLDNKMINDLIENVKSIEIGDIVNEYEVEYIVNLFNSDGNILYSFQMDSENNVYTNSGYSLTGEFIRMWTSEIVGKAIRN